MSQQREAQLPAPGAKLRSAAHLRPPQEGQRPAETTQGVLLWRAEGWTQVVAWAQRRAVAEPMPAVARRARAENRPAPAAEVEKTSSASCPSSRRRRRFRTSA